MKTGQLKDYAPQARRDFIAAVTDRAAFYGLTANKIVEVQEKGDVAIIAGRPFPRSVAIKRKKLEEQIRQHGFEQVMEKVAYTWFNRLVAIRFMELHGYLDHGYRVLSHPEGKPLPEIVEHAEHIELPGLDQAKVVELKLDGNKENELYRLLLVAQCNALSRAMPFLFESIDDETELLLPDNLLHSDSLIRTLVKSIDEEDWQEVEIIGWLYQFYISERYEAIIGKVVGSEDIPAATQRFTPKWVVKYLVQNSLGRQWMATYPTSPLKAQMAYYIEPSDQAPEVQAALKEITPKSLNPEELTLLDPACGSGHILVEAYDLLKAIYQERGYRAKDIPRLILEKNLFGLEIDDRAAQLAALALMMKARADDRRFFADATMPHVHALLQTSEMDATDIAAALSLTPDEQAPPPPGCLFETDDNLFTRASTPPSPSDTLTEADVAAIIGLFRNARTLGSLVQIPLDLAVRLPLIEHETKKLAGRLVNLFGQTAHRFLQAVTQARILADRYDCVVANPPYMGGKYYNSDLKEYIAEHYKDARADLYACFIQRNAAFIKPGGFVGMITIPNWMFLSSFLELRTSLITHQTVDTLIHNGRGVFGTDYLSCSFVFRNVSLPAYRGVFRRLFDQQGIVQTNEEMERRFFSSQNVIASSEDFQTIPGCPLAYWVSDNVRSLFRRLPAITEVAELRQGMSTGNGDKYLRLWFEVSRVSSALPYRNEGGASTEPKKWYPYNKGGPFRKWYGNREYVLNYENNGHDMRSDVEMGTNRGYRMVSREWFFRPGITWTDVGLSALAARSVGPGFIFENTGSMLFPKTASEEALLGFLCSSVSCYLMAILNPTVHFTVGEIKKLPFRDPQGNIGELVKACKNLACEDWDSFETSWDFETLPVIRNRAATLQESHACADQEYFKRFLLMKQLEEENNSLFITSYGLERELSPEVTEEQISLYRPNRAEDSKRLLSYAIGCMMGRYSLDKPGLMYAHSGSKGFDPSQYKTFPADRDGIVPLTDFEWFEDDTAKRFEEFIATAWPKEHLEENRKCVAESLGPKSGESSRATIRRYLATGFYKHHLSMYKRRPIYWLFSSGKQRAFQALVYLHRYNEGTLSRMRTEYVVPLLGKISARIGHLDQDITGATGKHRRDLEKEQATLRKQLAELQEYDDRLRHHADQRIALDLDDGVKVNYAKFADLLAEVKAVTGGSDDE